MLWLCVVCRVCGTDVCFVLWQYEPELFPGLIYRVVEPKCTCLIFVSGKMVITGYKVQAAVLLCI